MPKVCTQNRVPKTTGKISFARHSLESDSNVNHPRQLLWLPIPRDREGVTQGTTLLNIAGMLMDVTPGKEKEETNPAASVQGGQ